MNRRNFLKIGALFVPVVAAPTVAYSFLWGSPEPIILPDIDAELAKFRRKVCAILQIPEHVLFGGGPSPGLVTVETLRPGEKLRAFAW